MITSGHHRRVQCLWLKSTEHYDSPSSVGLGHRQRQCLLHYSITCPGQLILLPFFAPGVGKSLTGSEVPWYILRPLDTSAAGSPLSRLGTSLRVINCREQSEFYADIDSGSSGLRDTGLLRHTGINCRLRVILKVLGTART